jgi:endonuclease G
LLKQRIAPTHGSYEYSKAFRNSHPDWYERGHLAQKYLTERVSRDAAWFTHNVANAVPQRKKFNTSTWLTLECLTGAWANKYERVWVITGPVFKRKRPTAWLTSNSNKGTVPVAIPISMFKIVMKRNSAGDFEALGFSMPQAHRTYQKKGPWDPAVWFKSISEIERMTGQEFLLGAPGITQEVKDQEPTKLWPVAKTDFSSGCKGQRIDVL